MRFLVAAMLVLVGGCNAPVSAIAQAIGPAAQDEEAALEIVWEGVYGMERASRPTITWFFDCIPDRLHVVVTPECWGEQATPANGVELQWMGAKLSDTLFVKGLDAWHGYLMNGNFVEWDLPSVQRGQQALISAGL